jgi:hypothetical protein
MSYWGSAPVDSDYAFNTICSYIYLLKERMVSDMEGVLENKHPEQNIVASIELLRVIACEFPKCFAVHFKRKDFQMFRKLFEEWHELAKSKIPKKFQKKFLEEANQQFELFQMLYEETKGSKT